MRYSFASPDMFAELFSPMIGNSISLRHLVPTGGLAMDVLTQNISLRLAEVDEVCRQVMDSILRFCGGRTRYEILTREHPRIKLTE
jgi:DNA/RNA-binding domain of Phe-tRNA-synthetase-like protein